jgi:hypothetical protein
LIEALIAGLTGKRDTSRFSETGQGNIEVEQHAFRQ